MESGSCPLIYRRISKSHVKISRNNLPFDKSWRTYCCPHFAIALVNNSASKSRSNCIRKASLNAKRLK